MMWSTLQLVHFNDVYHIPSLEQLSRFMQLSRSSANSHSQNDEVLTIFSGDGFSPSLEASVLKGEHMTPILDFLGVDLACYGNHDFDFGESKLIDLSRQLKFPWLLSNAIHRQDSEREELHSKRLLGCAEEYVVRTVKGLRIGFMGLAGTDWPSNCENLPPCRILSPAKVAQRLAQHLRVVEHCDIVIALTHMRLAEDMEVADATATGDGRVDLLLGGHDHEIVRRFGGDTDVNPQVIQQGAINEYIIKDGVVREVQGNIRIIKSGTDWKSLSLVDMMVQKDNHGTATVASVKVRQFYDIQAAVPIPSALSTGGRDLLFAIHARVHSFVQKPILHSSTPLDGRGSAVRSQETNLGNMLADAVRAFYDTDIAFFNSGGIRCDRVIESTMTSGQPLLARDIIDVCPFENVLVVKKVSGDVLLRIMENSFSDMHTDGRFLQISGLRVVACWQRAQGNRILSLTINCRDSMDPKKLDLTQDYTVAMSEFIARGFDGYTDLLETETLVEPEASSTDTGLLLSMFGHDERGIDKQQAISRGIERARKVTICGRKSIDGLPIVNPSQDGRIRFVECPEL